MLKKNTSWGKVAKWYNKLIEEKPNTYQTVVILPNLLRLMEIKKGEKILDLACGQGFFDKEFALQGAEVSGIDISKELIAIAKKQISEKLISKLDFKVSSADNLEEKDCSFDRAVIILAIQNIEKVQETIAECARVLKPGGKLFLVMNHPAFRIPKESSWGWDEKNKIQYRRIDRYLSESAIKIKMHPGKKKSEYTISFRRPLQFYFKTLNKVGFCVSKLEEWNSPKKSEPGQRAQAENLARKEIPLFLFIEATKNA